MHTQLPVAVGIDVAKASLSVCLLFRNGSTKALRIRNTETDITDKLSVLFSGFTGKVIMEATGHYHWLAAILLSEAGVDVRTINPLLATKYVRASIRKVKNDPADAAALARMALVEEELPASFTATREHLMLRKKIGAIASLKSQLQAMRASRASVREAQDICGAQATAAECALDETIAQLKQSIAALEREFEQAAMAASDTRYIDRLTSIPGVSVHVAAMVIHWFSHDQGQSAKSWVSYAGLDVSTRESGTWRGRCRLTKRGNSYLRRRLFSAAWGAVMHDEQFRAWYEHLRKQGYGYVESLVIISRKIVRIMYAVTQQDTSFDSSLPLFVSESVEK